MKIAKKHQDLIKKSTGIILRDYQINKMINPYIHSIIEGRNTDLIEYLKAQTNSGKTLTMGLLYGIMFGYYHNTIRRESGSDFPTIVFYTTPSKAAVVNPHEGNRLGALFMKEVMRTIKNRDEQDLYIDFEYQSAPSSKSSLQTLENRFRGQNKTIIIPMTLSSFYNNKNLQKFLKQPYMAPNVFGLVDEFHVAIGVPNRKASELALGAKIAEEPKMVKSIIKMMNSGVKITGMSGTPTNYQDYEFFMSQISKELRKKYQTGKKHLYRQINEDILDTEIPNAFVNGDTMKQVATIPQDDAIGTNSEEMFVQVEEKEQIRVMYNLLENYIITNEDLKAMQRNIIAITPATKRDDMMKLLAGVKNIFTQWDSNTRTHKYHRNRMLEAVENIRKTVRKLLKDKKLGTQFKQLVKTFGIDLNKEFIILGNGEGTGFHLMGLDSDAKISIELEEVIERFSDGRAMIYACVEKGSTGMDIKSFKMGAFFRNRIQSLNGKKDINGNPLAATQSVHQGLGRMMRVNNGMNNEQIMKLFSEETLNKNISVSDTSNWEYFSQVVAEYALGDEAEIDELNDYKDQIHEYMTYANTITDIYTTESITNTVAMEQKDFSKLVIDVK